MPAPYDEAVALLTDLRDLARRDGRAGEFGTRFAALREDHLRKPGLIARFERAGLQRPRRSAGNAWVAVTGARKPDVPPFPCRAASWCRVGERSGNPGDGDLPPVPCPDHDRSVVSGTAPSGGAATPAGARRRSSAGVRLVPGVGVIRRGARKPRLV